MSQERLLKVRFAGRLIDLLGHQMYGGAVPAVAELVANSWDADATKVEISIPEDIHEENAEIIVKDYGLGMTFDELNEYYLHIGYERRIRGETTPSGRKIMGRKGIGKLAGFGIAEDIVLKSVKDGHLVEFTLNYTRLRNLDTSQNWEFKPDRDELTSEANGVTVTFKKLKLGRNINADNFRISMARRFAIGADKMEISVNDVPITKEDVILEYRYPEAEGQWVDEDIPGFGLISYWVGFTTGTIQDSELRGFSIFARDRIAQFTPFFFNLSGGIDGQVALEYLTGQIKANTLDDDIDYIATDRQTVNWQFDKAPYFEKWGQEKIKQLCAEWKRKHRQRNIDRFQHRLGEFFQRIDKLSPQEKKDVTTALEKIASLERINEEDFKIIANSMVSGVERESVKKIIQRINTTSDEALPELYEAIKEWDIISAVSTAEVIVGKLEIIKQFKKHIDERLPEKAPRDRPDMQKFIREYPWLLGNEYEDLNPADFHHEHGIDKWIEDVLIEADKEFGAEGKERRRFDLLVIRNNWRIVVLELMRPGETADIDHVNRLIAYVARIEDAVNSKGTLPQFQHLSVYGLLIADRFAQRGSLRRIIQNNRNLIDAIEWKALFENVAARYKEFYDFLKNKAPDDPRIRGLGTLG